MQTSERSHTALTCDLAKVERHIFPRYFLVVGGSLFFAEQFLVNRPMAASFYQQEYAAQEHGPIGAAAVHHGPEAFIGEYLGLGGGDSHEHDDDERDTGQAGEQAEQHQHATSDFEGPDEAAEEPGSRQAYLRKAPCAEAVGEEEFLDAFGEEHGPYHQADEDGGFGVVGAEE